MLSTYGKVTVKNVTWNTVFVGAGSGEYYSKVFSTKAAAYSEARWIRNCVKLGKHPIGTIMDLQGYRLNRA